MQMNRSPKYRDNLFEILDYIAQEELSASENFKSELDELINNLPNFPYTCSLSLLVGISSNSAKSLLECL